METTPMETEPSLSKMPATTLSWGRDGEPHDEDEDDYQIDALSSPTKPMQRSYNLSIPELLSRRQAFGVSSLSLPPFARPRQVLTSTLASKIAWNPHRLQNMILTVGPGTPAAIVDLSVEPSPPAAAAAAADGGEEDDSSSESSSSSSSSSEEDEASVGEGGEEAATPPPCAAVATAAAATTAGTSSSGSSTTSTTTNPKRTLSDRMKASSKDDNDNDDEKKESTKPSRRLQQDMNLEATTTTSSGDEEDDGTHEAPPTDHKDTPTSDEEMAGYSDVEQELMEEDDTSQDSGGAGGDAAEEDDELTAREQFYLEVNQPEEHRMQFSSNDDDDDDESDAEGPQPRRTRRSQFERTDNDDDDEEEEDEEEMAEFREMAAEWFAAAAEEEGEEESDSDDDEDSDDESAARIIIRRRILRRSPSPDRRNNNQERVLKPSVRHQGCINTATWLEAGWRVSTVSRHHYSTSYNANFYDDDDVFGCRAMASEDCPTQLVTSGDDRQVKFWDIRHSMGSANPLPWGRNTHCPFASTDDDGPSGPGYKARWKDFYYQQKPVEPWKVFGNVEPLASMATGHRRNVFHVTPLWQKPGKVATCGMDGYLRLGDVEASSSGDANSSSIIISPEYGDDASDNMMPGYFSSRPGMCYSHHFLNSNVGLLCSERGLRKFDIRLPPRQQARRALVGGTTSCKSCAIWTVSSGSSVEEVDSSYVFVGGTGAEVALCDLRMAGGDSSSENARVVCQYRPKSLHGNEEVSVSGLDLSKDKKELLVSYESDQIYTFPIFPNAKSAAGPSLEEIGGLGDRMDDGDTGAANGKMSMMNGASQRTGENIFHNELASYGGHLNRFTFLKNAKYAGPNDEYICTGSDSGHAWIYERSTGAVVSLLNADNSTCNGVVPHPTLPFFITYGIDSTAKVWRATGPVDPNTDDSASGRMKAFNGSHYEMSPLTKDWDTIEHEISNIEQELAEADAAREDDEDEDDTKDSDNRHKSPFQPYSILPDQVLSRKELINSGSLGGSILRRFITPVSRIGNDLHRLPEVLRRNQFECLRGAIGGRVGRRGDMPVESDIKELMRRVSLIRLRHQADRLGVAGRFKPDLPWILDADAAASSDSMSIEGEETGANKGATKNVHPADLIPDNPSDWIPYDPEMAPNSRGCGTAFNCTDYGVFYRERYLHSDCGGGGGGHHESDGNDGKGLAEAAWRRELCDGEKSGFEASENAYRILHETARVLKDGGNEALRKGQMDIAAKRYDKAIRYCSVAFMSHTAGTAYGGKYQDELMTMCMKLIELDIEDTVAPLLLKWSPLLKVLISTRLNLSMLLLKQAKHQREVPQLEQAMEQAKHALCELQPFCIQKGKICVSYRKTGSGVRLCPPDVSANSSSGNCEKAVKKIKIGILKTREPEETYKEAKTLEAKAYFRLGSAQSDRGEYTGAVTSFEKSIECTLELNPDAKLDPLVARRLAEAKREKILQNKRQRKKFRMMFAQEGDGSDQSKKGSKLSASTPGVSSRKEATRRRTTALPVVSPATPGSSARTTAEDRGTQSE